MASPKPHETSLLGPVYIRACWHVQYVSARWTFAFRGCLNQAFRERLPRSSPETKALLLAYIALLLPQSHAAAAMLDGEPSRNPDDIRHPQASHQSCDQRRPACRSCAAPAGAVCHPGHSGAAQLQTGPQGHSARGGVFRMSFARIAG